MPERLTWKIGRGDEAKGQGLRFTSRDSNGAFYCFIGLRLAEKWRRRVQPRQSSGGLADFQLPLERGWDLLRVVKFAIVTAWRSAQLRFVDSRRKFSGGNKVKITDRQSTIFWNAFIVIYVVRCVLVYWGESNVLTYCFHIHVHAKRTKLKFLFCCQTSECYCLFIWKCPSM